jgi:hypothetical protein
VKSTRSILFTGASLFVFLLAGAGSIWAQSSANRGVAARPSRQMDVAVGSNLYCAGYIQSRPMSTENRIIGAQDEADKFTYSQNDYMYINMGRNKGVNVGDTFSVVRPRGHVKSKWSKKGDLGYYVEEVGALQVVDVKGEVSVARIKMSCDTFLLGDLVQPYTPRTSPVAEQRQVLDRFANPTGRAQGRIIMARDNAEMLARDHIIYVDLGSEDRVQVGDHLTIFRPLEKGNITTKSQHESVSARDKDFASDVYKGGKFSNQTGRKKGERAEGKEVTTHMAKEGRPANLRKVVGEAVVLNVRERTATVVITRNGQEIHTGDWVEIQ